MGLKKFGERGQKKTIMEGLNANSNTSGGNKKPPKGGSGTAPPKGGSNTPPPKAK